MINKKLISQIRTALSKENSVIACYVIGSAAGGRVGPDSDFDLAVVVSSKAKTGDNYIYNLIAHISFPKDLDLSVVDKSSSPLFLFQVTSTGICLYQRTAQDKVSFEAFVMKNYYDTSHIRNIYYSYLKDKFPYAN